MSTDDRIFAARLAKSVGYKRQMVTGGEPLLWDELPRFVKGVVDKVQPDDFWVLTNGLLLEEQAERLAGHGLEKVRVSLMTDKPPAYEWYTGSSAQHLDKVFRGLRKALSVGLDVRIELGLVKGLVEDADGLLGFVQSMRDLGVNKLALFYLHKTAENADVFDRLYAAPGSLQSQLAARKDWIAVETGVLEKDGFLIYQPDLIRHKSPSCKKLDCGHYCQGTYASYLYNDGLLTYCHHKMSINSKNIYKQIVERDEEAVKQVLSRAIEWLQ